MAYNNRNAGYDNNRGGYNNGEQGNNYNRNDGYRNNSGAQEGGKKEKSFEARFRLRGLVCRGKNGEAVTSFPTRNGGVVANVSLLVSKFSHSGRKDQNGNIQWNENKEYHKLVAFGPVASQLVNELVAHSTVEFVGNIGLAKEYQGRRDVQFVIESFVVKSLPKTRGGNEGDYSQGQGGYQQQSYNQGGYSQGSAGGDQGGVSYDERPDNRGQEYRPPQQRQAMSAPTQTPPPMQEDYMIPESEDDIPF